MFLQALAVGIVLISCLIILPIGLLVRKIGDHNPNSMLSKNRDLFIIFGSMCLILIIFIIVIIKIKEI